MQENNSRRKHTTNRLESLALTIGTSFAIAALFSISPNLLPQAHASGKVAYTYTLADLGQGVWGGGPLYADGTAGGIVAFSAGNGEDIVHLKAVSWTLADGGSAVNICFETRYIKGGSFFSPEFCTSDFGEALPITGTPVKTVDEDGGGFILRVTQVN